MSRRGLRGWRSGLGRAFRHVALNNQTRVAEPRAACQPIQMLTHVWRSKCKCPYAAAQLEAPKRSVFVNITNRQTRPEDSPQLHEEDLVRGKQGEADVQSRTRLE